MPSPFWLATDGYRTESYDTEEAAVMLSGFTEAENIYWCDPDNERMRPVTEEMARLWWEREGRKDADFSMTVVPECYRGILEDEIAKRERESEERYAGTEASD